MKHGRRRTVKRAVVTLLLVCIAVTAFLAAVRYARNKVTIAVQQQIEEIAQRTGITIEPGEVLLHGFTKVSIRGTTVSFVSKEAGRKTIAQIPEIDVEANLIWVLLRHAFPLTVTIFNPQVNLVRRTDGTWELPFLDGARRTDVEGPMSDNVYPLTVRIRSGRLEVRQEEKDTPFCTEHIDLSLRSSARRRGFRVRSVFLLPSVSEDRFRVEGWVYPAERRFDMRAKTTALNLCAINEFITGLSAPAIQSGVMDSTLDVRGVIGEKTVVRGSIAFSALDLGSTAQFLHDITGTADTSIVINQEINEVLIEELAVDTGFAMGSLSGTLAYGGDEPELRLKAEFDRFPVDELAGLIAADVFPTVSELRLVTDQEARFAAELKGTVKKPEITLSLSGPASRATFNVETERYGIVTAEIDLAEATANWSAEKGVSGELAVSDGTLGGTALPFTATQLAGGVSFQGGLVTTDSFNLHLDDIPVSVSGYADISPLGARNADVTIRCAIEDLSQNRYASRLKKVSMSGPAELTAHLRTLGESVRWDLDADLTDAVIRSEPFFHKPAGVNARVHLGCPVQGEKPLDADFRLSLGETRIAGHATIDPGKSPAVTALTLQSDELQLANLMPLLSLPVEVVEDTGTRLALVLNVKEGEPSIAADLSADHMRITSTGSQNAEPFLLELDEIRVSLEEDAVGYRSHLRCRKAKVSPPIPTLVKRGFHPEIMGGVTSPIRIDADIGEFVSEPYRAEQLRCAVLISESQLKLASATGRLAGGTFELQSNIMRDRKTYSLEYRCEGLDVEQMLSLVPEDSKKFSGELSANLSLSGRLGGFKSRSGQGSLTVTAGRIDSSYIISRMKGLDEAQEPNPIRFDRLRCDFSLDNDTINVSNLHLEKPGLVLRSQGTVTLDGYVDQLFEIEMSREVAQELSARKRWGLFDLLPSPNITTRPVTRTFRVRGRFGALETEVERRPLHVELVRGTLAFSERIVVAGVTVLALPARMFMDILSE